MKVRVHDKLTDTYFKSEVYAKINTGWYEKHLILVPSVDGSYMKFFDYLDKTHNPADVLINTITPIISAEWIYVKTNSVDKLIPDFIGLIDINIRFFEFIGYPWLLEDKSTLAHLLKGNSVSIKGSIFENRICNSDMLGWNYVETQEDADSLLNKVSSFHDSILKELNYISGGYITEDKAMYPVADVRKVTFFIESQWCNSIEMIFEGVTALNLRPPSDNRMADIFGASIYIDDVSVFFCDASLKNIDELYDGTWIKAYSLRWRFTE